MFEQKQKLMTNCGLLTTNENNKFLKKGVDKGEGYVVV